MYSVYNIAGLGISILIKMPCVVRCDRLSGYTGESMHKNNYIQSIHYSYVIYIAILCDALAKLYPMKQTGRAETLLLLS